VADIGQDSVRDYSSHYGYADSINRNARWGVLVVAILVVGIAYASNATGGDDSPPVSVLSLAVTPTTSTTLPAEDTRAATGVDELNPAALRTTTTSLPPTSTTSTTRPPDTTTTTRATTTTTATVLPTTTTTVPPTSTTTTVPTTTTTTVSPIVGTVHIHDLKGDARGGDGERYARIEVQIRNGRDRNQRGVLVVGRFDTGEPQLVSGTTNNKGTVIFESGVVDSEAVTFTVVDLILENYAYAPEDNRRGPSVTVEFD
jgi:hypothetical protein